MDLNIPGAITRTGFPEKGSGHDQSKRLVPWGGCGLFSFWDLD